MRIIPANISHAKKISYLIRKNIEHVSENLYTPIQKMTWSNQNKPQSIIERFKTRTIFCAFENKKLVGTIALNKNLVCGMYISYSNRGKGIGQKLLCFIENHAEKKNIQELILTASPNGYGFYLKNGYVPYGATNIKFEGIKYPETKMKKLLK